MEKKVRFCDDGVAWNLTFLASGKAAEVNLGINLEESILNAKGQGEVWMTMMVDVMYVFLIVK